MSTSFTLRPACWRYRDPPRTLPCVLGPMPGIGKLLSDTDTATEPAADRTPDRFQRDVYNRELVRSRVQCCILATVRPCEGCMALAKRLGTAPKRAIAPSPWSRLVAEI